MKVANDTVDFTGCFCFPTHIVDKTSCIEMAFEAANVVVHGTLTSRLVSVEVTFYQESRNAVEQNTKITFILVSVIFDYL